MGARYELLNANKMFLDFNIRFSVWFKGNKQKMKGAEGDMELNDNLLNTKNMFHNERKYMNPVKLIKLYGDK